MVLRHWVWIAAVCCLLLNAAQADDGSPGAWEVGRPIVTYWAGPGYGGSPLTDAAATRLAEGHWNLAWCRESELDVAHRHGLRAQLGDGLLAPAALDDPAKLAALNALIDRVKSHPALYSYFIVDEPSANSFAALGRLFAHLRARDPAHLAYINLFPTYATNEQLGTSGDKIAAYNAHLDRFRDEVRPALLSYDHYQFAVGHDTDDYFLNLTLVRSAGQRAGLPFLNIVQACTWTPSMREPGEGEMRYLIYTSLAYGAQGISYYVYSHPGHTPGIVTAEGEPTRVYGWLQTLNRDFAAIAAELQPLRSLGVYHAGMMPPGAEALPAEAAFQLEPPVSEGPFRPGERVRGVLLGLFGAGLPSHAVLVNLDYAEPRKVTIVAPGAIERFDPAAGSWSAGAEPRLEANLPPGGGVLVRLRPTSP